MLWKVIRRLLALVIRGFIWQPVVGFSVLAVALGIIGITIGGVSGSALLQGRVSQAAVASPARTSLLAPTPVQAAPPTTPPPAVDEYIKGMTTFNAHLMWEALDPQAIRAMESQGGSEQQLQQRLDDAKQQGASYDGVVFIGGYPLRNGDKYLFYVVSRRGFAHDQSGRSVADQVFFVFTVGPNGKIIKIE